MKTNLRRWIPTSPAHRIALGMVALAAAAGVTAAGASAALAHSAESPSTVSASAAGANASDAAQAAPAKASTGKKLPPAKSLKLKRGFELQSTYFYCGPAATRNALATLDKNVSQDKLAGMLGTTSNGTDSVHLITKALNKQVGKDRYRTVEIAGQKATKKQINQLRADVMTTINSGDPVVANIAGTVTDTKGEAHSYEGGHYIAVVGYGDNGSTIKIADSADTVGSPYYSVSTKTLADWTATRGYTA